jgi:hypothetical protein
VLELSRSVTIRDVARHLNVGWALIKEIPKRDLLRRYAKPELKHVVRFTNDVVVGLFLVLRSRSCLKMRRRTF